MKLRSVLVLLHALLVFPALHADPARPNIILIVTDDQRPDTIRELGNSSITTPHLDQLVQTGFASTGARIQGSDQGAVCVASRAMLWSGQSLWKKNDSLNGRITLGEALRANGYRTLGTGKWHNGDVALRRTFDQANNITGGFLSSGHKVGFLTKSLNNDVITTGSNVPPTHSTDLIGATAVDFIGNHPPGEPFFLYVGFNAPHDPFTSEPSYVAPYKTESGGFKIPLPENFMPQSSFDHGAEIHTIRDEVLLPRPLQTEALLQQNTNYYAMISQIDHWVGQITASLQSHGMDQNTIIIFTSDHGLARGSHGLLGKQNLYEHSLKVPLILHGPGIPAGKKNSAPVYLSEVFPTILDYAQCDLPANQVNGVSIRPLVEGKMEASRRITYHAYTGAMRCVIDGQMKLIEYHNSSGRFTQLFNVETDPNELNDLSESPEHENDIARLRGILWQQKQRFEDNNAAFWNGSDLVPDGEEDASVGKADIQWQTPADTTGISNLIAGNPVHAVTGSANAVTVGGIRFTSHNLGLGFLEDVYTPLAITSTGNAAFDQLVSSLTYGGGAGATLHTIRGLQPGANYTVQVFFNDQRAAYGSRTMMFKDASGNTASVLAGKTPGAQADDYGQYAIGTFVAEAKTQALYLQPSGFGNSHFNAILVTGPPGEPEDDDSKDSDQDGYSDAFEKIFGTDPFDPASRPGVALSVESGMVRIGWMGCPDRDYQIEVSDALDEWTPQSDIIKGNGRWQEWQEPTEDRKFFRIVSSAE